MLNRKEKGEEEEADTCSNSSSSDVVLQTPERKHRSTATTAVVCS